MFRWKEGLFVKVLINQNTFSYARLLTFPLVIFYKGKFKEEQTTKKIASLDILFKVWCHKSVRSIMEKVEYKELEPKLKEPVKFYKKDLITKKLFIYENNKQYPATREQIKNLECAAVWEKEHILERLNAELEGKESKYKKDLLRIVTHEDSITQK